MSSNTKVYEEKMKSSVEHLGRELAAVRAGRANPAVLDKVTVDYYGAPTPIQQVASVAVSEARTLTITDNGIGMTTEQIEQLLNPEESPKNRRGLNGIGISNINQRIKMTYGQEYGISITSKPGAYTDVLICIPYERSTSL